MSKIFYAAIREKGSKKGSRYKEHKFTACDTKAEVRSLAKQNGMIISGGKVYTSKEWNQ
jgi:hypothetical protein